MQKIDICSSFASLKVEQMKKLLFIAAVCALMLTGCNGLFVNKDDDSTNKEQNGGDGGNGSDNEEKLPDDTVIGWKMTSTNSSNKTQFIQEFTFKYDKKGRCCGYDEKYTNSKGETTNYKRNYVWVNDDKLTFGDLVWTLSDGRATKYENPNNGDEDRPNSWTFSYKQNGELYAVNGEFFNYLDENDRKTRSNWKKTTEFAWSNQDITKTREQWMSPYASAIYRNERTYTYTSSENPFYGHAIDPVHYYTFDKLWFGIYGPTTRHLPTKIQFNDTDYFEEGGGYYFYYKYSLPDQILREIIITRMDGTFVLANYIFHIYYAGIEDAEPFQELN